MASYQPTKVGSGRDENPRVGDLAGVDDLHPEPLPARTLAAGAAALLAVGALLAAVGLSGGSATAAASGSATGAVLLGALAALTGRDRLTGLVSQLPAVVALVLGAVAETCLLATGAPGGTAFVLLAVVTAGLVVPSPQSLVVVLAALWVGWAGCALRLLVAPAPLDPDLAGWAAGLLGMVLATALAALAARLRAVTAATTTAAVHAAEQADVRDALTGLMNRRGLVLLGQQIVEVARRQGDAVHCILVEVHGLRGVNDALGYRAGDDVLVAVAEVLRTVTRGTDAVARWGGDKFCVLGPGPGPGALDLERRLRAHLASAPPVAPVMWPALVTAVSAMLAPWDAGTLETLLDKTDVELQARRVLRGQLPPRPVRAPAPPEAAQ